MGSLSWRLRFTLLTFFVGAVSALVWIAIDNKSVVFVKAQSRPLHDKTPELPPEDEEPIRHNAPKSDSSIRYIKGSGAFCEKYLLKKIAKEKSSDSQLNTVKNFNPNNESLSPNVKKWLENMSKDDLLVAVVKNNQRKALLLRSKSYGATGLATSLEYWHIEIDNFYSDDFWSFSRNPKLVFWDKAGLLNYYSVIYSDEFLSATSNRDYNNLTFNIERYRIRSDGKAQLVSEERNLKCE